MAEARVVVVGSSNTDLVIRTGRLPSPGETVTGGTYFTAPGGKGANQAVAAARAGAAVTFVGAVGDDAFGEQAVAGLRAEGIDTRFVRQVDGCASGVAMILVGQGGENLISVAPGANWRLEPADVEAAREAIGQAGVVVLELETAMPTVARAARLGRDAGATVLLNPAPFNADVLDAAIFECVDVWIPNETEAGQLTGVAVTSRVSTVQAAEKLRQMGARLVVVTLGPEGCLVVDQTAEHLSGHAVEAIDTVAAGDAFIGAVACRLAEGATLVEAAGWGNAAGALAATGEGAQPSLPQRERIEALANGRVL